MENLLKTQAYYVNVLENANGIYFNQVFSRTPLKRGIEKGEGFWLIRLGNLNGNR